MACKSEENRREMCQIGGVPLLEFCLIGETVADTGNGEDKAPVFGNRFDLLPQLAHIDVQAVRPGVVVSAPIPSS